MPKVILISQLPLPYSKIGSWTTLYKNYLKCNHLIDYIICQEPVQKWEGVTYSCFSNNWAIKIKKRLFKNPYLGYLKALQTIMQPNEHYIIQIVDNFGIIKPLHHFLLQKGNRKNCYLQFFYHGYAPFYGNFESRSFFETINEMVLLTNDSYATHKNSYTILPSRFSVLYNGIDTDKFFPLPAQQKATLKNQKGIANQTVFVWCSQDRPKKGLHIILEAWKRVYATREDEIVLWVIGCEAKEPQAGIIYFGRIPNDELPHFLQLADCYLFSPLWHEGFGMSLIEALHCGNFCIASGLGGVPEVLQYGKLGKLIDKPNFVEEWEQGIRDFLAHPHAKIKIANTLYSSGSWNKGMNQIIQNAKNSF